MNRLEMQAVMKRILQELGVRVVRKPLNSLRKTLITDPEIACSSGNQALELGEFGSVEHFGASFGILLQGLVGEFLELVR